MRQFICEALNREGVIDVRHRAQPADADVSFRWAILDAEIWQIVRNVSPALLQMARIPVDCIQVKNRWNRREDRPLQPCHRLAVRAQRSLHIHGRDGVVVVKLDVVLSCPDHLHRPAHFLGQDRGLSNVIGLRLASESSTKQGHMANHIFFPNPELLRNYVLHGSRILRRSPQCRLAVFKFR